MTEPSEPKFNIGDLVMDTMDERQFIVGIRHFDPCDGWEYGPKTISGITSLYFEEDLEKL